MKCCVLSCGKIYYKHSFNVSFFGFPADKELHKLWLAAIRRPNLVPQYTDKVCSLHFKPEDMISTGKANRLRLGAIPYLSDLSDSSDSEEVEVKFEKVYLEEQQSTEREAQQRVESMVSEPSSSTRVYSSQHKKVIMSVKGLVAIITGASSGIGAGTAVLFAERGAKLVLIGRKEENLTTTAVECYAANKNADLLILVADMTKDSDVERIIDETIKKFGQIDILVNNAGVISKGSIENTCMEQYDYVMNTNVRSVYHLTMLAVPHLIKTQGTIVNVSSVNGLRAFSGVLAYCVSKAAVDQFTRSLALELAPKGVRVNSVNPGVVITQIHKRGGMSDEEYEQFLKHSKTTHAMGRPGTVKEIAKAIYFLASSDSSNTTGINMASDGGRHAMVSPYDGNFISF